MALDPDAEVARREELQAIFEALLGTPNVYFQPPANKQMEYPCIVYKRDKADTEFADNSPYRYEQRYMVTFIAQSPSETTPLKIAALPKCTNLRYFAVKNLNHDVFILYF